MEAGSADEALGYLCAGAAVDLVLSDIRMPGSLDGLALARHCQRNYPGLPVILASADVEPQQLEGACAFIPKPFSAQLAIETIGELLGLITGNQTDDSVSHPDRRE